MGFEHGAGSANIGYRLLFNKAHEGELVFFVYFFLDEELINERYIVDLQVVHVDMDLVGLDVVHDFFKKVIFLSETTEVDEIEVKQTFFFYRFIDFFRN